MSLLCYNKGCGQRFEADGNSDDACTYHPGVPVFHDALKGWSCCRRRTTDFSDFLNIAGCTKGQHSNEKPLEPVKPEVKTSSENEIELEQKTKVNVIQGPKPIQAIVRPSQDEPLVKFEQKVSPSLRQTLEKLKYAENEPESNEEGAEVKVGMLCKNTGCNKPFVGPDSYQEVCVSHSGGPIFHEGMKYWSCCKRKTSDFNVFLSQEGCVKGKHLWTKTDTMKKESWIASAITHFTIAQIHNEWNNIVDPIHCKCTEPACWLPEPPAIICQKMGKNVIQCRRDWHQTGGQVIITIYAKNSSPELSFVEANSTVLNIHIVFQGEKEFQHKMNLWGVIDVTKSHMNMTPTKVEVTMRKAEPMLWARLELPPPQPQKIAQEQDLNDDDQS